MFEALFNFFTAGKLVQGLELLLSDPGGALLLSGASGFPLLILVRLFRGPNGMSRLTFLLSIAFCALLLILGTLLILFLPGAS